MPSDYWHRQNKDDPLFPDLVWSRPENRTSAGKLLIIGGNAHGFAAPAEAYQEAMAAGLGTARVLLPDALQKTVGTHLEAADYAPTTPSGSFSRQALEPALELAAWSDSCILAGDLGRNSETAILVETLLSKYTGQAALTKDAVDYAYSFADTLLERKDTLLVLSLSQLQRLSREVSYPEAITFSMDLIRLVEWLHGFTNRFTIKIIICHLDNFIVASGGEVSTTKIEAVKVWRVKTAAHASVWWLQHPNKAFEALTTSVIY